MGTWVTCPECFQNLPRKFKSKKERKEIHETTCSNCKNKNGRKNYEMGVKRGIWLKKWGRAVKGFSKASEEFVTVNDTKNMLISELMGLMSGLYDSRNKQIAQNVVTQLTSGKYNGFLNQDFFIPEFKEFDSLYYEARGWNEYLKIDTMQDIYNKVNQMKTASHEFFNIGYGPLFFSPYFITKKLTNVDNALQLEAESEEMLGFFYASRGEVDTASNHLENASSAYISLENSLKARQLKMVRQSLRMETACWICGARSQGHRQTFHFKYTGLNEQHYNRIMDLLKQRQDRNPTFYNDTVYTTKEPVAIIQNQDVQEKNGKNGIYLATCTVCQGLLDELSTDVVNKALIPVWNSIHGLQEEVKSVIVAINNIQSAIEQLSKLAHRH